MPSSFYPALIFKDAETDYGVVFPDLPACVTGGETAQEAALDATQTLARHIQRLAEDKAAIPPPSAPDAALPDWLDEDDARTIVARVLVPVELPGRAVRIDITIDEALLARLDAAAAWAGSSRSDFIAEATRARLRQQTLEETTLQTARACRTKARQFKILLERYEREGAESGGEWVASTGPDRVGDEIGSLKKEMIALDAAAERLEAEVGAARLHSLAA
jgi:predicted RNase H-like HicB family nuclease/uncharacterized protein (DUF1778 family)